VLPEKKYTVDSIGPQIKRFLKTILRHARLRLTPHVVDPGTRFQNFENPDVMVTFTGPDVNLLLANRAALLLALEHLTMEMLRMPSSDHARLLFDARDYRMLRIEELRMSALAAAERVKMTGEPYRFSPMSSRERRIIHLALRDDPEVRSESTGTGSERAVVVYPAHMPSLPPPPPATAAAPAQPPPAPARGRKPAPRKPSRRRR